MPVEIKITGQTAAEAAGEYVSFGRFIAAEPLAAQERVEPLPKIEAPVPVEDVEKAVSEIEAKPVKQTRGRKAKPKAAAPVEKTPEPDPETKAQDDADEAAETSEDTPTIEKIRLAVGKLAEATSFAEVTKRQAELLGAKNVAALDGEPEEKLQEVLARIEAAVAAAGEAKPEPAPDATTNDVLEAMKAYNVKFGGDAANENIPKILGFAKYSAFCESKPSGARCAEIVSEINARVEAGNA